MKHEDIRVKIYVSDPRKPIQVIDAKIGVDRNNVTVYVTQFGDVFEAAETWIENVRTMVELEKARHERITKSLDAILERYDALDANERMEDKP